MSTKIGSARSPQKLKSIDRSHRHSIAKVAPLATTLRISKEKLTSDDVDRRIAKARLREINDDPSNLVSGAALRQRLEKLLA